MIPKELQGDALVQQVQDLNNLWQSTALVSELTDLLSKEQFSSGIDDQSLSKLVTQTLATIENYAQVTTQISVMQSALLDRVAGFADNFVAVPMLETDIADINGLVALGENLNIG